MKIATFFYLAAFFLISCNIKKENAVWVMDKEGILTHEQIKILDSMFKGHERKTSNEIVLLTTPDFESDTSIVLYAVNFSRKNKVGKKGKNNGIVIVFSKAMHQTRIATGYGTEKVLTDDKAQKIIDSLMLPQFRNANYFAGLLNGSRAIIEFLERPENKIR